MLLILRSTWGGTACLAVAAALAGCHEVEPEGELMSPVGEGVPALRSPMPPGEEPTDSPATLEVTSCGEPVLLAHDAAHPRISGYPPLVTDTRAPGLRCFQYGTAFSQPVLFVEPLDAINDTTPGAADHAFLERLVTPIRSDIIAKHGCFFDYCTFNLMDGAASVFSGLGLDDDLKGYLEPPRWERKVDQARQVELAAEYIYEHLVQENTQWGFQNTDVAGDPRDARGNRERYKRRVTVVGLSAGGVSAVAGFKRREREGKKQIVNAVLTYDSPHDGAQLNPKLQRIIHRCREGTAPARKLHAVPSKQLLANLQVHPTLDEGSCTYQTGDYWEDRTMFNTMYQAWRAMGNHGFPSRTDDPGYPGSDQRKGVHVITLAQSSPTLNQGCQNGRNNCQLWGGVTQWCLYCTNTGEQAGKGCDGFVAFEACKTWDATTWSLVPGSYYEPPTPGVTWQKHETFVAWQSSQYAAWTGSGWGRTVWDAIWTSTPQAHDALSAVNRRAIKAYLLEYQAFDGDGCIDPANAWGEGKPGAATCTDSNDANPTLGCSCVGTPAPQPCHAGHSCGHPADTWWSPAAPSGECRDATGRKPLCGAGSGGSGGSGGAGGAGGGSDGSGGDGAPLDP